MQNSFSIILLSFSAQAQQKPIDLDSAITIALANHPNIKAANLEVEKNQSLQNLKYNLGNTDITYQGDGLVDKQFGQQVNQIGVVQNFPSPSITKANNKLQDELAIQSTLSNQQTVNELKWKVKQLYFEIQYNKELEKLYTNLSETYSDYYDKAKVRVEVGQANSIEALTLKAKWNEYQLLLRQIKIQLDNLNTKFQLTLNSKEPVTTKESLAVFNYSNSLDTNSNIFLQQSKQNIAIESTKVQVLKSDLKPSFNIGYSAQNYYSGGWFNAAQAGVSIPLFNGQTKKRVEAQKIQIDIANYQYQSKVLAINQELSEAESTILLYNEGVQFYKEQLQTINPEIVRIAQLNYQEGELSYLELLNTLQLMATNNKNYWEQIIAYNKAVVDYQFLTNQ